MANTQPGYSYYNAAGQYVTNNANGVPQPAKGGSPQPPTPKKKVGNTKSGLSADLLWHPHLPSIAPALNGAMDTAYNVADSLNKSANSIDENTAAFTKPILGSISNLNDSFNKGLDNLTGLDNSMQKWFNGASKSIYDNIHVSSYIAGPIGALDGVVRDPLNPDTWSAMATSIMEKVSPGYAKKLNASMEKLHFDKLKKAPGLLFSSIKHLVKAIDNILAVPIALVSTIYYGIINYIRKIGKLINDAIQGFQELLFSFLDSIIPIGQILQLLQDISTLAGQIGGLASVFGGTTVLTGITTQLQSITTTITNAVTNPVYFVTQFLPGNVNQAISNAETFLTNPASIINKLLPQNIQEILSRVQDITGFGFNGNNSYNFAAVLKGDQPGIVESLLNKYTAQYKLLSPLVTKSGSPSPESQPALLQAGVYDKLNMVKFQPTPNPYAFHPKP
jgi:hypothetical protein